MRFRILLVALAICFVGCSRQQPQESTVDYYQSDFFKAVQMAPVFPDSKTFVDCTPKESLSKVLQAYDEEKNKAGFDLKQFVTDNFDLPVRPESHFTSDESVSLEEHINRLWPVLTRHPDNYTPRSSLIPLPYDYIVPGGRFSEVYYWDSYFTMEGLEAGGREDMVQDMLKNFAFLIDSIGHIPNGNRNYYVSRSQPPFFSLMVGILPDSAAFLTYLPELQKEYDFWMTGSDQLSKPGDAVERVVMVKDGAILNRYWDDLATPRPEAFKEDTHVKEESGRQGEDVYRDLRAAAESGWDFCTRWFENGNEITSIHTTDMVPPDLNSLMYHLEQSLAYGYAIKSDTANASKFRKLAEHRRDAIMSLLWDSQKNFFMDYNFRKGELTGIESLAGMYPLFCRIPTPDIAESASKTLEHDFLKPGGLVATLTNSGQQWDAPNGWAPLQWVSYRGLKNYGQNKLADEISKRWLRLNDKVFHSTGKMMEKYNVMDTTVVGGGGEYPNQDGFGWTNGIDLVFLKMKQH